MRKLPQKIGIMGGTFDPIHLGHLVIAEFARNLFALDQVIFVPTNLPPHKGCISVANSEHRYNMVQLAIRNNDVFTISRIEVDRKGPSYTIDTLRAIKETDGEAELFFIIGADAVAEIMTWKNVAGVMQICNFLAANRPGYKEEELLKKLNGFPPEYRQRITTFEIPALDLSSTEIRMLVKKGLPIKYLVPEQVEKYIIEHHLYL